MSRTKNYSIASVDVFDFNDLNSHIMAMNTMLRAANGIFGQNSETYRIAEFLENYFRY